MKALLFVFSVLTIAMGEAQENHRLKAATLAGYAYNYFKSPNTVLVNGDVLDKNDLIASSTFQDIALEYDYRKTWKGHHLSFNLNPFARLFHENMADSYWALETSLKYNYKFNKKTKVLAEVHFERMNREGLDGAQDVLVNPLGFTNYGSSAGVQWLAFKRNRTTMEAFYNFKNFDAYGIRDLQFNEYGVQLSSKQKFRPGRYSHAAGLVAYYKKRQYETFNAEADQPNGERNWDYSKIRVFYRLPLTGHLELEPQLIYYGRYDRLQNRSGFHQYGPGLRLRFDNDKTRITGLLKYQLRNYTKITAPGTDDLLHYQYMDISIRLEHRLPIKGMFLTGTTYNRFRETNTVDQSSRSFRSYTYQYMGVGLLWKI
ncbi:MAG: hypothetical protein AAGA86_11150 [Bacteroidota bacterium]